jgi:hypothetical protein
MRSVFYPNGFPIEQATLSESDRATKPLYEVEPETQRLVTDPVSLEAAPPSSLTAPTHLTFPEIQGVPLTLEDRMTLPNAELLRSPAPPQDPLDPPVPPVRVIQLESEPPKED